MPYFGTGTIQPDQYAFRSQMCPSYVLSYDVRNRGIDYALLKKLNEQWREVASNYFGDYYPLTPYTLESGEWVAWQFNRPEAGEGFVQVFLRAGKSLGTMTAKSVGFKLQGLDENATYELKNFDEPNATARRGFRSLSKRLEYASRREARGVAVRL